MSTFSAEIIEEDPLSFCSHFHTANKCPFLVYYLPHFSHFSCFLLVISLFKIAPKQSAVFFTCKKAVMCHMEKIYMLDKLHSGIVKCCWLEV